MPKFISDSDMEKISSKKKFISDSEMNSLQPSKLESALRGAAQGATLGFGDELVGAGESALGSLGLVPDKTYEQSRDESRLANAKAQSENPITYGVGEIGGGVASNLILPGSAATMGGRALQAAATGAIMGAGTANNRDEILPSMAVGGALGGVAAPLTELGAGAVSKGANKLSEYLSGLSSKLNVKATGATGLQASKFKPELGQEMKKLDLGWFDGPQAIANKMQGVLDESGKKIGSTLEGLDAQGASANINLIVGKLQSKIDELSSEFGNEKIVAQLKNELNNLLEKRISNIPLTAAEAGKRNFQAQVNYNSPEADKKSAAVMANLFKNEVEDAASATSPEAANIFKENKRLFGLYSPVQEAAQKRASTLSQSPMGGLLDVAAVSAGGGGPLGLVSAAARKVIAPRGANIAAKLSDKVSNLLQTNPQALGKYAKPLSDAIARGPAALASTNFLLQQTDPEYRKLVGDQK